MSSNLFVHAMLAGMVVVLLAAGSWRRVLKDWPSDRRWMRLVVTGLLLVTTAGVGLVFLTGPNPWQYSALSAALYVLAFALGLWARRMRLVIK